LIKRESKEIESFNIPNRTTKMNRYVTERKKETERERKRKRKKERETERVM
jgi:hypothetical protein